MVSLLSLPPPEVCDRARAAKDHRFDGLFFTAVSSTGIYCRPVCPAPSPKRENIAYFASAAAASAAGYRPCLRCRPELSPDRWHARCEEPVQRALELIAEGFLQDASVVALSKRIGLSSRQLQRVFMASVGATPHTVHATRRLLLAKQLLTETRLPVTQVALAAGYNSLRRFNAAFLGGCGLPPSAIRRQRGEAPMDQLRLRLAYRPPLDFSTMLAFLERRAIPGIERVTGGVYERVIGPVQDSSVIRISADPERPELQLELAAMDPGSIPAVVRRARRLFDLDADLQAVHAVLAQDDVLASALVRRPGLRVPCAWDGFEMAVRAVLGQQISVAGATTLARRLVERFGEARSARGGHTLPEGLDRAFPTPERLRHAELESIGLPRTRAASLRALAAAVHDGRLSFEGGQRIEEFIDRCVALPGIGDWTAQYLAMRGMAYPDAFPAGDLILQQRLGHAGRLSERETQKRSLAWRPWRAYAVIHVWQSSIDMATGSP